MKPYTYTVSLELKSSKDITEDDLLEMGLEVKNCIASLFKSKRMNVNLDGLFDVKETGSVKTVRQP